MKKAQKQHRPHVNWADERHEVNQILGQLDGLRVDEALQLGNEFDVSQYASADEEGEDEG